MSSVLHAFGIDLGTTNSAISYTTKEGVFMVPTSSEETSMPSLFTLDEEGQPLIGHKAKNQKNPQDLVSASKRLIGRNFHRAEELQQLFTYDIIESSEQKALVSILDQVFTMEEISAAIIAQLCNEAQQFLGKPVEKAVLTVPTYFDESQRRSIKKAGEIAGLEVLRILNEPTAAALAYGNKKNLHECVAVYDLGGGTFDLSIVKIANNEFDVLASGGNPQLGGVDFDDRILKFFLEYIYKEYGYDLAIDKKALHILRETAEQTKITLSSQESVHIQLTLYAEEDEEDFAFSYTLTRTMLENLTQDLVDATINITLHLLEQLQMKSEALDKVLLVGGQSLMPLIHQKITSALGFTPSRKVHPKEIVAKGASLMAFSLLATQPDQMKLQDRLPMTIGVRKSNGSINPIFEKGSLLPCKVMRTLPTVRDDQNMILLHLYQGNENLAKDNEELQTFIFSDLRPGPKGSTRIEALFELNDNGILRVKARDRMTKKRVIVQALSAKELEEFLQSSSLSTSVEEEAQVNPPVPRQEQNAVTQNPTDSLITEQPSTLITVTPGYFSDNKQAVPLQEPPNTEKKKILTKNQKKPNPNMQHPKKEKSKPTPNQSSSGKMDKVEEPPLQKKPLSSANQKLGFFQQIKQWFFRILRRL